MKCTVLRYTQLNIRLGRNVKCACDDCCGLANLAKRFEQEGRLEEAVAAKNALKQHKKRAEFKQKEYRVERLNAHASFYNGRRKQTTQLSTPIIVKTEESKNQREIPIQNPIPIQQSCPVACNMTVRQLQTAGYPELKNELREHGIKCRNTIAAMRTKLESHYIQRHGLLPVRGSKRTLDSKSPALKKSKSWMHSMEKSLV